MDIEKLLEEIDVIEKPTKSKIDAETLKKIIDIAKKKRKPKKEDQEIVDALKQGGIL